MRATLKKVSSSTPSLTNPSTPSLTNRQCLGRSISMAAVALAWLPIVVMPTAQADSFSAGVSISDEVKVRDTGLATYPGAAIRKSNPKAPEVEGANVDLSFGAWGMKIVVAKLVSQDKPEAIATFYREQLGQYGAVLDCSNEPEGRKVKRAKRSEESDLPKHKRPVRCEHGIAVDPSQSAATLTRFKYKVGTEADQRIVSIKTDATGQTEFALMHVSFRSPE